MIYKEIGEGAVRSTIRMIEYVKDVLLTKRSQMSPEAIIWCHCYEYMSDQLLLCLRLGDISKEDMLLQLGVLRYMHDRIDALTLGGLFDDNEVEKIIKVYLTPQSPLYAEHANTTRT